MRAANLALRFLLELAALALLVMWGLGLDASLAVRVVVGVGAAAVFAVVWGAFVAPKAGRRLPDPTRLLVELVLFGVAAAVTFAGGDALPTVVFVALVALNEAQLYAFDQRAY